MIEEKKELNLNQSFLRPSLASRCITVSGHKFKWCDAQKLRQLMFHDVTSTYIP
jgi:hypothetical protein